MDEGNDGLDPWLCALGAILVCGLGIVALLS